jgi:hypothetical protein
MANKKFVWDDSALEPEVITVNFPVGVGKDGGKQTEEVKFIELPRKVLIEFISEAIDKDLITRTKGADGEEKIERRPLKDVATEQEKILFKYLAKGTWDGSQREVKKPEFFEKLDLSANGMANLIEMFLALNHIEEIAATGGNWFLLPQVRRISAAGAEESESPKPTLPA